jgi:hypothetical protein
MRATKLLIIIGIVGLTLGAQNTIKQKLAQKSNTLAQAKAQSTVLEGEDKKKDDDCGCDKKKDDDDCDCGCGDSDCSKATKGLPFKSCAGLHKQDLHPLMGCTKDCKGKYVCDCDCDLPELTETGVLLGGSKGVLGSAVTNSKNVLTTSHTDVLTAYDPNTESNTFTEEACCSCADSANHAFKNETRIRHFNICGDICVVETVKIAEQGCAEEASFGHAQSNSTVLTTNFDNTVVGGDLPGDTSCKPCKEEKKEEPKQP